MTGRRVHASVLSLHPVALKMPQVVDIRLGIIRPPHGLSFKGGTRSQSNREKRMFRNLTIVATVAMLAATQPAFAQGATVTTRQLSGDAANAMVLAAVEQCRKDGYKVAAAIVDRAGNLQAYLRDSGAGPQTMETSRRKAFTSAAFGITSAEFATRIANPGSAGLKDVPGVIALAGGVAIKAGNEIVGGIGVGGAPGGEKDEACAAAGLAKIADRLK
jgi:uncharacterized protein GlcG (DUF336 family)